MLVTALTDAVSDWTDAKDVGKYVCMYLLQTNDVRVRKWKVVTLMLTIPSTEIVTTCNY